MATAAVAATAHHGVPGFGLSSGSGLGSALGSGLGLALGSGLGLALGSGRLRRWARALRVGFGGGFGFRFGFGGGGSGFGFRAGQAEGGPAGGQAADGEIAEEAG